MKEGGVMAKLIDLTNKTFDRLTVVRRGENTKQGGVRWICLCDCGNIACVSSSNLRRGITKSCGCYSREVTSKIRKIHGMTKTRLYGIWLGMKERC